MYGCWPEVDNEADGQGLGVSKKERGREERGRGLDQSWAAAAAALLGPFTREKGGKEGWRWAAAAGQREGEGEIQPKWLFPFSNSFLFFLA